MYREITSMIEAFVTPKMEKLWDKRHWVYKQSKVGYQKTGRIWLGLARFTGEERVDAFDEIAELLWQPTTKCRNFAALLNAMKAIGQAPTSIDKEYLKKIEKDKRQGYESSTVPLTRQHFTETMTALLQNNGVAAAMLDVAFTLGQRLGDVARIQRRHIGTKYDEITGTSYMTITLHEGKTIRRLQPYTVHLPTTYPTAIWITTQLRQTTEGLLFPPLTSLEVRNAIKRQNQHYNILSIRKGGLQNMMDIGLPDTVILHHSRHKSMDTFMIYMDLGRHYLSAARETVAHGLFQHHPWDGVTPQ